MFKPLLAALALSFVVLAAPVVAQDAAPVDEAATAQDEPAIIDEGGEPTLPGVIAVRVSVTPQRARVIFDLNSKTEFAIASLGEPDRIALDVRAAGLMFTETPPVVGQGLVSGYEVSMAEEGRARALLTLAAPAQVQQAYFLEPFADQPARLVIDIIPATAEEFAANVARDMAASQAGPQAIVAATPTEPGSSSVTHETRPLVVIDPGHGGVDNGATAPNGIHEKDIVLAFALDLQKLLIDSGRFDVALTREDDSFLRLDDRVALARENKADLFISIHADSFQQPEIRGASVYTRDERATDELDKVLAQEENKADLVAGYALPTMDEKVVDILIDLMQRETRKDSYVAAQAIVHQLEPSVTLRRFPVRQANFFVLQAPDVPSVLVELGFLSNAEDIANLTKSDWQDRVSEALARGINAYFDAQKLAAAEAGVE